MGSICSVARRARLLILFGTAVSGASCAKHDVTAPQLDNSVAISSNGPSVLAVEQTLQLSAIVRDTGGATLTGQSVTWTSSDTTIASVAPAGVVTAKGAGSATITATCDGRQATRTFTIVAPIVQVLVGLSPVGSLAVGGSTDMYVDAITATGDTVSGLSVTWSSATESLATVAPLNTAVAIVTSVASAGTVSIVATIDGVSGSAPITIVPLSAVASITVKPSTITYVATSAGFAAATQMSVIAVDTGGAPVFGVPVTWSVSDPTAATMSTTGLLTPNPLVLNGKSTAATITGTVAALSVSTPLLVCPQVATIIASTTALSLEVGQSVVVAATALDGRGNLDLAPLDVQTEYSPPLPVSVQRVGFDSLMVTGTVAGTARLDFRDAVSGLQSQFVLVTVTVTVTAAGASGAGRSFER